MLFERVHTVETPSVLDIAIGIVVMLGGSIFGVPKQAQV